MLSIWKVMILGTQLMVLCPMFSGRVLGHQGVSQQIYYQVQAYANKQRGKVLGSGKGLDLESQQTKKVAD